MTMIDVWVEIDGDHVAQSLQEAQAKLENADGEVVLEFSAVRRMNPPALRAIEDFVGAAEEKSVRVALRGVNIDVYKVLKLARMSSRFSVVN